MDHHCDGSRDLITFLLRLPAMKIVILFGAWAVLWCATTGAQEDSLRSALSAVDKRQRYLNRYADDALAAYTYSDDNNLEFLIPEGKRHWCCYRAHRPDNSPFLPDKPYYRTAINERALLEYLQNEEPHRNERKKSINSPFRERVEEDRERQRKQFAKYLLSSMNNENDDGVIYGEMIDDFIDKYPKKSRYLFPTIDKPANRYDQQPEDFSDAFYALSYLPGGDGEEESAYYRERNRKLTNNDHKRYPVSKRSSDFYDFHKKLQTKKTDPKVERDLSNVFGPSNKTKHEQKKKQNENTKEIATPVISKSEPFDVKKKSINWSDYFGLDRRKKSDADLDKEWLMERYHKAVSMTAKRSTDYPLQHFHIHDQQQQQQEKIKKDDTKTEEDKIKEIDEKLKNIEDAIVDDAIKYTGAHEGTIDSKEVQEVKDRVISRLAAAYSLEKMRRALGEYKLSVAKEKNRLKQTDNSDEYLVAEEKRVSVPRKEAVDEESDKTQNINNNNNIKCTGDGCDVLNLKMPSRILDQYLWGIGKDFLILKVFL